MPDVLGTNTNQLSPPVVITYSPFGKMVRGNAAVSDTTPTTIIAAQGTSTTYVTALQFGNTSTATIFVTMNDSASSTFIVPSGGGSNAMFLTPLTFAAGSAVVFTSSSSAATIYANAQGFTS